MAEASSSTVAPTVVRPQNVDEATYAAMQLYRSVRALLPLIASSRVMVADNRKSRNMVVYLIPLKRVCPFAESITRMWRLTTVRIHMKTLDKDFNKTEDDMKALQSVGQVIGEVLKQLDHERCKSWRD